MPSPQELEEKFWKALSSDMTMMLGLEGVDGGHLRPMTAQFEDDRGPIWFFCAKDNGLIEALAQGNRAVGAFASKGHDLFATVHGSLHLDTDPAVVERFWNRFVAAWYPGGKEDPDLALLRFDTEKAEIWLDGSSLIAGAKLLLGVDPKKDYQDKVAQVSLG